MKKETTEKMKFKGLKKALGIPHFAAVGLLEAMWHITAKNAQDGGIGRFSDEEIAAELGWEGDASALITALVSRRWLDESPIHRLVVHDWPDHCEDSVHTYLARNLTYFADGSAPSFAKLNQKERDPIKKWFAENPCAHCAHIVRTDAQNSAGVRTSAQVIAELRADAHDVRGEAGEPAQDCAPTALGQRATSSSSSSLTDTDTEEQRRKNKTHAQHAPAPSPVTPTPAQAAAPSSPDPEKNFSPKSSVSVSESVQKARGATDTRALASARWQAATVRLLSPDSKQRPGDVTCVRRLFSELWPTDAASPEECSKRVSLAIEFTFGAGAKTRPMAWLTDKIDREIFGKPSKFPAELSLDASDAQVPSGA